MPLHRMVNGVRVEISPEEESQILAEWQRADQEIISLNLELARLGVIDQDISSASLGATVPKTVAELKAMSLAEYSAWFDANFDTAAKLIALLKRLTLVVIRRVA